MAKDFYVDGRDITMWHFINLETYAAMKLIQKISHLINLLKEIFDLLDRFNWLFDFIDLIGYLILINFN